MHLLKVIAFQYILIQMVKVNLNFQLLCLLFDVFSLNKGYAVFAVGVTVNDRIDYFFKFSCIDWRSSDQILSCL